VRKFLFLWLLGWALFGLPWTSFTLQPHLYRISLVPFRRTRRRDQFLNFVYYVPLGVIGVLMGWAPGAVAALAASLSGLTEALQIFSTDRIPSTTDLLLNTAGAVLGISVLILLRPASRSAA
jgi:VanZ family protein